MKISMKRDKNIEKINKRERKCKSYHKISLALFALLKLSANIARNDLHCTLCAIFARLFPLWIPQLHCGLEKQFQRRAFRMMQS